MSAQVVQMVEAEQENMYQSCLRYQCMHCFHPDSINQY
jgi:hypothetical protein